MHKLYACHEEDKLKEEKLPQNRTEVQYFASIHLWNANTFSSITCLKQQ